MAMVTPEFDVRHPLFWEAMETVVYGVQPATLGGNYGLIPLANDRLPYLGDGAAAAILPQLPVGFHYFLAFTLTRATEVDDTPRRVYIVDSGWNREKPETRFPPKVSNYLKRQLVQLFAGRHPQHYWLLANPDEAIAIEYVPVPFQNDDWSCGFRSLLVLEAWLAWFRAGHHDELPHFAHDNVATMNVRVDRLVTQMRMAGPMMAAAVAGRRASAEEHWNSTAEDLYTKVFNNRGQRNDSFEQLAREVDRDQPARPSVETYECGTVSNAERCFGLTVALSALAPHWRQAAVQLRTDLTVSYGRYAEHVDMKQEVSAAVLFVARRAREGLFKFFCEQPCPPPGVAEEEADVVLPPIPAPTRAETPPPSPAWGGQQSPLREPPIDQQRWDAAHPKMPVSGTFLKKIGGGGLGDGGQWSDLQ